MQKYTYAGTANLTGGDLSQIQSIAVIKAAVRVASIPIGQSSFGSSYVYDSKAQTITSSSNGQLVLDSVSVNAGDRVLIKDEITYASNNGIYVVTSNGSLTTHFVLTRASDFNRTSNIPEGALVPVVYGNANVATVWMLNTTNPTGTTPYVLDSSPAAFTLASGGGSSHISGGTITNSTISNCSIVSCTLVSCFVSLNYLQYQSTDSGKTIDVTKSQIQFSLDDLTTGAPDPHAAFTLPANASQPAQLLILLNVSRNFIYPITINATTFCDATGSLRSSFSLTPGQSVTLTFANGIWWSAHGGYT